MYEPKSLKIDQSIQLKLGIKSSFSNIKSPLAFLYLLWKSNNEPVEIEYASEYLDEANNQKLKIKSELFDNLMEFLSQNVENPDRTKILKAINNNILFTNQIESLKVALELIWKICIVDFKNEFLNFSAERAKVDNKSIRYSKIFKYTKNIDLMDLLLNKDQDYIDILLKWLLKENVTNTKEYVLVHFFTLISEEAIYKIRTQENTNLIFSMAEVYQTLVENSYVSFEDCTENMGSSRILKNIIKSKMNYYVDDKVVTKIAQVRGKFYKKDSKISLDNLSNYSQRLMNYRKLLNIDIREISSSVQSDMDTIKTDKQKEPNLVNTKFLQKIFYGAPGTGKSYKIGKLVSAMNGSNENSPNVFRTTIYSDYSYSDFIGTVMPVVVDKKITYEFVPGVFTKALVYSFMYPNINTYLIIEEMTRGDIANIFGDIFQLLDRNQEGRSVYFINNSLIFSELKKSCKNLKLLEDDKIYLPSNFSILGTVNSSDQNVNIMDNAFKRRFDFEFIDVFPEKDSFGNYLNDFQFYLGGKKINWINFYISINKFILEKAKLNEDKQIGQFFIIGDLSVTQQALKANSCKIKDKLLKYLWEDVNTVIFDEEKIFINKYQSFSQLYNDFERNNIFNKLINFENEPINEELNIED